MICKLVMDLAQVGASNEWRCSWDGVSWRRGGRSRRDEKSVWVFFRGVGSWGRKRRRDEDQPPLLACPGLMNANHDPEAASSTCCFPVQIAYNFYCHGRNSSLMEARLITVLVLRPGTVFLAFCCLRVSLSSLPHLHLLLFIFFILFLCLRPGAKLLQVLREIRPLTRSPVHKLSKAIADRASSSWAFLGRRAGPGQA